MKKSKIRIITMLLTMVLCMSVFSVTAFAGGDDELPTEPPIVTEPTPDPEPLTPEGNLTLVDDLERTDEIDKQFITAVSKNGNYFYLVIDRAGDEDNVYLLNMVDEADLMALMEGTPVVPEETPEPEPTPEPEVTEPTEPQPEEETNIPMGLVALLAVFIVLAGGAFYYFKVVKNKPKAQGNPNINEYDYGDDDEDEYSYEPTAEEQDEPSEESEDDLK